MTPGTVPDEDAEDTEAALMAATYHALREYGYAGLTVEKIGEAFEKSNSLLYHHYDGKDDLVLAFLEHLLERWEASVPFEDVDDPWVRIQRLLDHVFAPEVDEEHREFASAMIELRAQAAHDPAFREAFSRHDRYFQDRLTGTIAEGIESGRFRDVDAAGIASFVQTAFVGALTRRVTTDDDAAGALEEVREELEATLERRLLAEGRSEASQEPANGTGAGSEDER